MSVVHIPTWSTTSGTAVDYGWYGTPMDTTAIKPVNIWPSAFPGVMTKHQVALIYPADASSVPMTRLSKAVKMLEQVYGETVLVKVLELTGTLNVEENAILVYDMVDSKVDESFFTALLAGKAKDAHILPISHFGF